MTRKILLNRPALSQTVQPQPDVASRDDGRLRVLMLTTRFPYPTLGGDKLAFLNCARSLRDYRITLLTFCSSQEEMIRPPEDDTFAEIHRIQLHKRQSQWNALTAIPSRTPLQLAYYRSREFQQKLNELAPRHDLIIAHLIRTGQYVVGLDSRVPRILLMSDAISMTYDRMSRLKGTSPLWSMLYRIERNRLHAYESTCPANFDQAWLHSEVDRRFLGLDSKARTIPVGVDLSEFPFDPARSGDRVVFIGNVASSMNQDACRYFVREILPRIQARANIRFRVIGFCPPRFRQFLERHEGVEVIGAVPHIHKAIDDAFCGVCSIRGGAGMQNKILNYLALGLPCITSEIGLGGIPGVNGRDLLVYRTVDQAAEAILRLHGDRDLRRTLAMNGRNFVERNFALERVSGMMAREAARLLPVRRSRVA